MCSLWYPFARWITFCLYISWSSQENHIFWWNGIKAYKIFTDNNLVSSSTRYLQTISLWYARKAVQTFFDSQPFRETLSSSIDGTSLLASLIESDINAGAITIGLKNLGSACYFNTLTQMIFLFPPIWRYIIDYPSVSLLLNWQKKWKNAIGQLSVLF